MLQQVRKLLRINWPVTLWLNYRLLPFNQAKHCPLVVYGSLRFELGPSARLLLSPAATGFGSLVLGSRHETYQASAGKAQFTLLGCWRANGKFRLGVDSCLYVHQDAVLTTGDQIFLARDTQIDCNESITLGNHLLAGEIYLCDTAAHAVSHAAGSDKPMTLPIHIDENCYFGHRTMVLRGVSIPANSVVGSGAVCCRNYSAQYSEGHIFLTGVPAQVKAENVTPDCSI